MRLDASLDASSEVVLQIANRLLLSLIFRAVASSLIRHSAAFTLRNSVCLYHHVIVTHCGRCQGRLVQGMTIFIVYRGFMDDLRPFGSRERRVTLLSSFVLNLPNRL